MGFRPLRLGTNTNDFPSTTEFSNSDLASLGGLDLEDLGTHLIQRSGNNIIFQDLNACGPFNLSRLVNIFGESFNQAYTAGNFTTSSSTFQTIQTVPSTAIQTGNYVVLAHNRFLKTTINGQLGVRMQINGANIIDEEEVSLDDDDFFFGHTMLTYVSGLSGNITVTAQIRRIDGSGSVQAESRTLMYWRVS